MSDTRNSSEKDDFWSLEKLIPKKKPLSHFATRSAVSDFTIDAPNEEQQRPEAERKISFDSSLSPHVTEYEPNHPLIKSVKIKRRIDKYDFYGNFRKAAIAYLGYKTEKCPFAEFYSYMPQYSQLSASQRAYYFYWRAELYRGNYIKSDYSYIYLFVYEILNLPDLIPPREGLDLLLTLWCEYRRALPRIDLYFSIWVQDYCLVHRLDLPDGKISDFIFDVIGSSSFPEFYLTDIENAGERGLNTLLAYISDYDYRRGKYVDGNPDAPPDKRERQKELYRTHMQGGMREVLRTYGTLTPSGKTAIIKRDAFPSSLCTHSVKCMLEIEYYSLSLQDSARAEITAAVRYAENKLRAIIGVKSRLAVRDLPERYREILDGYFGALEARERKIRQEESRPAYEELYSAPNEKLSGSYADEIESISWATTQRLVEGALDEPPEIIEPPEPPVCCNTTDTYGLGEREIEFLRDALYGAGVAENIETGALFDTVNSAFAENFGDIVLEDTGECYTVIEDYKEEVSAWLLKIQR